MTKHTERLVVKLVAGLMVSIAVIFCLFVLYLNYAISQVAGAFDTDSYKERALIAHVSDETRISFFEVNEKSFEALRKTFAKKALSINHDFSESEFSGSATDRQTLDSLGLTDVLYEKASQRLILKVPAEHGVYDGSLHGYAYCEQPVRDQENSDGGTKFFVPIKAHWYVYHVYPAKP